ncbi:MAG TPA: acyl-CoA thioesterase [Casimicrobiaceae bacterium]
MAFRHVSEFLVEFGDCDPAQIVFYPNFARWMDAAALRFFAALGVPPWLMRPERVQDGIIGTPIVDLRVRFIAPATYGDRIEIETSIVEWRRRSFVMQHVIRRGATLLVEGREVRVFARRHPDDPARIEAVAAPEAIRERWRTLGGA